MERREINAKLEEIRQAAAQGGVDLGPEISALVAKLPLEGEGPKTAMDRVRLAREIDRPTTLDYVAKIFDSFMELHGDRAFGDDTAIVGGIANIGDRYFTVIGHQKGRNMKENLYRNYGWAKPEGYRKALRLAQQAAKFGRPIVTFVDTAGAYPGVGSEERGIGEAIAKNLKEFSTLGVPILCFIIGEGGSGGALGLAIGDEVWMLENAIYSVITPEGCATILLRDAAKSAESAELLRLGAREHLAAGVIEGVIAEPAGGAQNDPDAVARAIKERILESVARLSSLSAKELLAKRFDRFMSIGASEEKASAGRGFLSRYLGN
jgi:acetyl-CoA carboxylase carboxyl transferase subunit alpha